MGCINAKRRKEALRRGLDVTSNANSKKKQYLKPFNTIDGSPEEPLEAENIPELTDRQIELVLETWNVIQKDMSKVGVIMFMK